eukprot:TRINITY_DN79579_c0_g1_i1.p2 TRINITY_DN79579_c0_g1~~TRINITY_DN79579_c0_g1_i1.p2  ORF type:complete len:188 (-),score=60.10 TRINITY_DN79579_c0_g1_i1:133-669(-)
MEVAVAAAVVHMAVLLAMVRQALLQLLQAAPAAALGLVAPVQAAAQEAVPVAALQAVPVAAVIVQVAAAVVQVDVLLAMAVVRVGALLAMAAVQVAAATTRLTTLPMPAAPLAAPPAAVPVVGVQGRPSRRHQSDAPPSPVAVVPAREAMAILEVALALLVLAVDAPVVMVNAQEAVA